MVKNNCSDDKIVKERHWHDILIDSMDSLVITETRLLIGYWPGHVTRTDLCLRDVNIPPRTCPPCNIYPLHGYGCFSASINDTDINLCLGKLQSEIRLVNKFLTFQYNFIARECPVVAYGGQEAVGVKIFEEHCEFQNVEININLLIN